MDTTITPVQFVLSMPKAVPLESDFESYSTRLAVSKALRSLYHRVKSDEVFFTLAAVYISQVYFRCTGRNYEFEVGIDRMNLHLYCLNLSKRIRTITYDTVFMRERESWDEYFMGMASRAAERTTCVSGRKVGSVFVRDKIPLISGFNGVPPNVPHPEVCARTAQGCKSGEGLHLCPCLHSEANAIGFAARMGISLRDSTLYCTALPCTNCAGQIVQAGTRTVIYRDHYPGDHALEAFQRSNIKVQHISDAVKERYDSVHRQ